MTGNELFLKGASKRKHRRDHRNRRFPSRLGVDAVDVGIPPSMFDDVLESPIFPLSAVDGVNVVDVFLICAFCFPEWLLVHNVQVRGIGVIGIRIGGGFRRFFQRSE
jgi:hypothetical protein